MTTNTSESNIERAKVDKYVHLTNVELWEQGSEVVIGV